MVFVTWQPSFFKPNLDRIAFVESASDKAPYPFFHWKYSRWLGSKAITVFGLPLFMFAMMWFCFLFTHVDPKRQNISPKLIRALVWFMAALSPIVVCSSYAIALGINVNITLLTYLIIGLMLLVIGNYLAKTKQNYSAGIRIPWTLSSEENWNRTHRFSSRLFIFCGLAMIANGFLDSKILLFFIMAVLIVIPYAYSFFLFKKGI